MPEGRFDLGKGTGRMYSVQPGAGLAGNRGLARRDFRRKRFAALAAKQIAGELGERVLVDLALEIDYRFQGYPVVVPAPRVEFRSVRGPQAHIALAPDQPQQEPDLLLPPVIAAPIPFEPLRGHFVAQPIACPSQDLHMGGQQAHLFPQFAVHRLHRRFPDLDPALRELPGVFLDALAPENLVASVAENDADVRPVAVSIEHTQSSKSLSTRILSQIAGDLKAHEFK